MVVKDGATLARLIALEKMLDEREDRTKERFNSMKTAVDAALMASDRAVTKAEEATQKRFESVNEFRETLSDQAAMLMPRAEFTVQYKVLEERCASIEKLVSAMQLAVTGLNERLIGRSSGLSLVGQVVLGIIAFATAIAVVGTAVWHH